MMIYFLRKSRFIILFYLIYTLFILIDEAPAEEFIRVKGVIGVNSNISAGIYSVEKLTKLAQESNVGVLILTDHALARGEYGIWPFRHLIRKVVEEGSILKFGAQRYLDLVNKIDRENPQILVIPACEVAPFYWWQGSFLEGNLTVYDWSKQLIVIGLNNAKDYQNLPIISNKYKRLRYGLRSLLQLWSILGIILGLWFLHRKKFRYIDDLGKDLSPPNFLARWIGRIVIIISAIFLINNFPFTIPDELDPYHGEQGILPYQRLIDYANLHNALSFWTSIESSVQNNIEGINFFTFPHKEDLFRNSGFTGFSVIYGDSRTVHNPGAEWDELLNDYCLGKSTRPVWGIGETGFQGSGEIDYIHNVLFLREFNKKEVFDALNKGRLYAIWSHKENEVNLVDFSITDCQTNQIAYIGQELLAGGKVNIHIKGYQSESNPLEINFRLIRNGKLIKSFSTSGIEFEYEFDDQLSKGRKSFYRLIVTGPAEIITNPIFIKNR